MKPGCTGSPNLINNASSLQQKLLNLAQHDSHLFTGYKRQIQKPWSLNWADWSPRYYEL